MGAGKSGDFGNTFGSKYEDFLDRLSRALALASLIPGADSFIDLAAIPVDILRKDWVSVGLDAVGIIPYIGEIGDTARLAKLVDKTRDNAKNINKFKLVDKTIDETKAANKIKKAASVKDNYSKVAKKYNLNKFGSFGEQGKNCRVFKSKDPVNSSADFYKKISAGGTHSVLPNGKGVQTIFNDGSRVVYRVVTKTPGSPAVEIIITELGKVKKQKIHFIRK